MNFLKRLLIPVLILLINTNLFAQFWVYQVSNTTQHLNGVYMIDAQTGWICGDAGTLLRTTNGGQNWVQVNVTVNDLNSIAFFDDNTGIAAGDNGTIIRTTNMGQSWAVMSSGTSEQFRKVAVDAFGNFFAAGDNGLFAVSADNGATWQVKSSGTLTRLRSITASGSGNVWVAGDDGTIRFSSNSGDTWTAQSSGILNDDLHDIQFVNGLTGFAAGSSSNFIFTSDGGQTWVSRNSGIFFGMNGIYFQNSNVGWGVSIAGTIFFTTDAGLSWTSQPCGSAFTLREAHFIHQGKGWTVGDNGTVVMYDNPTIPVELVSFTHFVSGNDVNLTWTTATENNNRGFEIERATIPSSGGSAQQLLWEKIGFLEGRGTTTEPTNYLFEDQGLRQGAYNYRIKQIDFNGTSEYFELSADVQIGLPEAYELSQNYPNPFNPSTQIRYQVPVSGNVSIRVFDVIGNEVAILSDGFKEAGEGTVEFDATGLSSGIYYYRMDSNDYSQVRKMILIK